MQKKKLQNIFRRKVNKRKNLKICSIESCENKILARGWCDKHYERDRKYGDPEFIMVREFNKTNKELLDWITSAPQIRVNLETKCLEWRGRRDKDGYGLTNYKRKTVKAHRLIWFLTYGYMPKNMILHSCDNPCCINIKHLREGSAQDNVDDMVKRNRQAKGTNHGRAKLDEKEVIAIKELSIRGKHTQAEIGKIFGVVQQTITKIVNRKIWAHV